MTLIIKELIIRGNVIRDNDLERTSDLDEQRLQRYISEMQKQIEKDCVDQVLYKLERELKR